MHEYHGDYEYEFEGNEDWKSDAEWCLEKAGPGVLRYNQIEFLEDIIENWNGSLTEAQQDWLDALIEVVDISLKTKADAKRLNR